MGEETIGERLKRLRLEVGLSQRQLAKTSGIDREYICQIEGGKTKNITLRIAKALAKGLGKPPEILMVDEHRETADEILDRLRLATPITIPIYTDFPFHAGNAVEPIDYIYRARHKAIGKDVEGYIVQGNCLEPQVFDGDIIIIDKRGNITSGDVVACLLDGRLCVARLKQINDELWLENNIRTIKLQDSQITVPVIEIRRRLK